MLGHDAVLVDLPANDASAGLREYADTVIEAVAGKDDLVIVAHSFGGFTGPLVCERVPVDLLVFVAGMIPSPGEAPAVWWANTKHAEAQRALGDSGDDVATYYHDVPPDLAAEAMRRERDHPSERAYDEPWPMDAFPDAPIRFLLCRDDRVFPARWLRDLVLERLGITPDEIDGGHCPNLARPDELARALVGYVNAP